MTYVSEISKWWVYPHGSLLFSTSLLSSWIYGKSCLENVYRDLIYMRKNAQNGLCGPEEINRALLTSQMITQPHHSRMIRKGFYYEWGVFSSGEKMCYPDSQRWLILPKNTSMCFSSVSLYSAWLIPLFFFPSFPAFSPKWYKFLKNWCYVLKPFYTFQTIVQ